MRPVSDPIDRLLSLDLGSRGIAAFFTPGGAVAAARSLSKSRRVLITTGFNVGPDLPETDGPPGAAVLGRALRTLGADVTYVTDATTVPVLRAALEVVEEPDDVEAYPDDGDAASRLMRAYRPTHLVSIERPGRSKSGDYLNARGGSVREWNAPIDELFLARSRAVTIGIGDGGNEIGMGNVRARLTRQGALMARIASVVRADHLVIAGTSNWGAYGVVAGLARLSGRVLLHDAATELRLVDACVEAGAVDGLTRRREATVDGLPMDVHTAIVTLLGVASQADRRGMMGRSHR